MQTEPKEPETALKKVLVVYPDFYKANNPFVSILTEELKLH